MKFIFNFLLFSMFIVNQANAAKSEFDRIKKDQPTIVFVHLGSNLPVYIFDAIDQAFLFNECNIVLIANEKTLEKVNLEQQNKNLIKVNCEDINESLEHDFFKQNSILDKHMRDGFWHYATERLYYLAEFITQLNLTDVFHLENDVMLYEDVSVLLPVFKKHYKGIGATFDNDDRCIPAFIYISDSKAANSLQAHLSKCCLEGLEDMASLGRFRNISGPEIIQSLPIICKKYISLEKVISKDPYSYSRNFKDFNSVFDAAYFGQYLGGVDPRNEECKEGYINPHCIIKANKMKFRWRKDKKNRKIPYVVYGNKKIKINNLHIHSKNLKKFSSLR